MKLEDYEIGDILVLDGDTTRKEIIQVITPSLLGDARYLVLKSTNPNYKNNKYYFLRADNIEKLEGEELRVAKLLYL